MHRKKKKVHPRCTLLRTRKDEAALRVEVEIAGTVDDLLSKLQFHLSSRGAEALHKFRSTLRLVPSVSTSLGIAAIEAPSFDLVAEVLSVLLDEGHKRVRDLHEALHHLGLILGLCERLVLQQNLVTLIGPVENCREVLLQLRGQALVGLQLAGPGVVGELHGERDEANSAHEAGRGVS